MICVKHSIITTLTTEAYAGFLRGGGPTLKFFGLRVGMLRAIAMGFGGMHLQENFFEMMQFRAF